MRNDPTPENEKLRAVLAHLVSHIEGTDGRYELLLAMLREKWVGHPYYISRRISGVEMRKIDDLVERYPEIFPEIADDDDK